MVIYPHYYTAFQCIAGACRHSCCIGWEIDVDNEALERYEMVKGELGERLVKYIDRQAETPHFILGDDERCPFLNKEGLCDLILAGGDELLCQICADHPRFRNFYSNRIEVGIGLCCEAAAELIMKTMERIRLVGEHDTPNGTPEEEAFWKWRNALMEMAQDRSMTIEQRMLRLAQAAGIKPEFSPVQWARHYLQLECLDPGWFERLQRLEEDCGESPVTPDDEMWSIPLEQLLVYFMYRHLAGGLEDGRFAERLAFCLLSVQMICRLSEAETAGRDDLGTLIDIARQYSAEIEYSEENLETLWQALASGWEN